MRARAILGMMAMGFGLPAAAFTLPAPKSLELPSSHGPGPRQVGFSRRDALHDAGPVSFAWRATPDGVVATLSLRSPGAAALRLGIALHDVPSTLRLTVGSTVLGGEWIRRTYGTGAIVLWTPSTEGEEQVVEIRVDDQDAARRLGPALIDVSHFTQPVPVPKLLGCQQNYSCSADAQVQHAGPAVAKVTFVKAGAAFLCSGALLADRPQSGTPWFATANHCVSSAAEAASAEFEWFNEQPCGGTGRVPAYARSVGAELAFTDAGVDFTLLRLTGAPPPGVRFLDWDPADLAPGDSVFGIHHPGGSPKAYSIGKVAALSSATLFRGRGTETWNIGTNRVSWQAGITEAGSSGSPLLTGSGVFRGTLSAGPDSNKCTQGERVADYSRFSQVYPRIRQFIDPSAADVDAADSAAATFAVQPAAYATQSLRGRIDSAADEDWFRFELPQRGSWLVWTEAPPGMPAVGTVGRIYGSDGVTFAGLEADGSAPGFFLSSLAGPGRAYVRVTGSGGATGAYLLHSVFVPEDDHPNFAQLADPLPPNGTAAGVLESYGDSDKFAIDLPAPGRLTITSSGSTDVVGHLYDASSRLVAANDDRSDTNRNFEVDALLPAGRYFLDVFGHDLDFVGAYSLKSSFTPTAVAANYTAFWWNAGEPGWGLNVNHQGDRMFASLYTYAADGRPLWLAATGLQQQPDGSFTGALTRFTGPSFFQLPFTGAAGQEVGTMTLRFETPTSGTMAYTFDGAVVGKAITLYAFGTPPACMAGSLPRAAATNYQDLWWNPAEPGWGLGLAHQGNTIFAAMYNYDGARRDVWFAATALARQPDGSFTGALSALEGPPFNTVPWRAPTVGDVGTMTLRFGDGETGTLSYTVSGTPVVKNISRFVFGAAPPTCR